MAEKKGPTTKSYSMADQPGLFYIDKAGKKNSAEKLKNVDISSLMSLDLIRKDIPSTGETSKLAEVYTFEPRVVLIADPVPQESPFEVPTEERVFFQGQQSYDECSEDTSDAEKDYINNLAKNGENCLLEGLANMNLEHSEDGNDIGASDLNDDVDFANVAAEHFLCRSPSTTMEYSLDETAAQFLTDRKRAGRQKRAKGKGHLERKANKNVVAQAPKGRQVAPLDQQQDSIFTYDGPYTVGGINFKQINRELKMFINDAVESELEMDPMPPLPRKCLHELAHMYGLKSKSNGSGRDRHCVLYKTERSCLPRNSKSVMELVERADKAVLWMDKTITKGKKFTQASVPAKVKEGRRKKDGQKGSPRGQTLSTKPAVGFVVGESAAPIKEDNVGNIMLRKLGWKPGESLGSNNDGIVDPLQAVVRGKRAGLGHSP